MEKKLAIFGAGKEGMKLYEKMRNQGFHIDVFFDNFKTGIIEDAEILKISDSPEKISDYFLVVSSKQNYMSIRKQLLEIGLTEYKDFVPAEQFYIKQSKDDSSGKLQRGVNLIGYAKSEHGVGEACRDTAKCLRDAQVPWMVMDYEINNYSRQEDNTLEAEISKDVKYNVSIFHINADQMANAKWEITPRAWSGFNIGRWYWELEDFPNEWIDSATLVNEIWAPTGFIQKALERKVSCPVIYMPYGIEREKPNWGINRKYFGLPNNVFLFLNMFDVYSYSGRKNPHAVITAYKTAFPTSNADVGLVLKINNSAACDIEELRHDIEDRSDIYLIDKVMNREEINGLIVTCDAAISLHRSEGLGLLCMEAMFFGKPVIATNWSGNTDFMNKENSCLVNYNLTRIEKSIGPYAAGQRWAEADVGHAAYYMRKLQEDSTYYKRVACNAKSYISDNHSTAVCGKRMRDRLDKIWNEL